MRILIFTLVTYLFLNSGCISQSKIGTVESPHVTPTATESVDETYIIYSAILNKQFPSAQLLVTDHTNVGLFDKEFRNDNIAGLSSKTVTDYNEKQIESEQPIRNDFVGNFQSILFSQKESKALFGKPENVTGRFRQKYPNIKSIVTFSRIGFNAEKTQALVCISHWCGGQCGAGTFYFLMKTSGKWAIQWEQGSWVS